MTLQGHHSEIWCMAVNSTGTFIITGSHDRSLRFWEQTDEQLFPEEERENEMEAAFEESLENPLERGKPDVSFFSQSCFLFFPFFILLACLTLDC